MKQVLQYAHKTIFLSAILAAAVAGSGLIGGNLAMAQTRNDAANAVTAQLYKEKNLKLIANDAELDSLTKKFIYADVNQQVKLPLMQQELLTLAVLTAGNTPEDIPLHVRGALNAGASPEQVRETIFHCTPYVGAPRAKKAMEAMYAAFKDCKVKLPLADAGTVDDSTRYEAGLAVQKAIFGGEHIDAFYNSAPADQKHINYYLSEHCFGDFYTRRVLSIKERELITFTALAALGGCEPQVKAHVGANISVGNTRQDLQDAITIALPYIGYPRTLNALGCINAVAPAQTQAE